MFESREAIVKIGKFTQCDLVFGIDFPTRGLILFGGFFYVGGGEAVHLSHQCIGGLGQINDASVKGAPFAFGGGPRALAEDNPVDGLGSRLVVEPDFASR